MPAEENVVLVTIDSLRADHCGYLDGRVDGDGGNVDTRSAGEEDPTAVRRGLTPTLDRFAREGVAFEQAIAPGPRTPSSVPATLTGHFDREEDLDPADWRRRYDRISEHLRRHRTVAERFRERGYETIGISANPWTREAAFDRGFDTFLEIDGDDAVGQSRLLGGLDAVLDRLPSIGTYDWNQAKHWLVDWTDYYDDVLAAVEDASEPYFLWVFLLDVHQPYLPPRAHRVETSTPGLYAANVRERMLDDADFSPRLVRYLEAAYRDAVRSADAFLGELEDDLTADDPAIVVHADHGEAFGEHGTYGHERALYEENLHVPLVVANGGATGRVRRPVSLTSLPDLLTAVGDGTFGIEGELSGAGVSRDDATDPSRYERDFVPASTEGGGRRALRGERWKFLQGESEPELYDLETDPGEQSDLSREHGEVEQLLAELSTAIRTRQDGTIDLATAIATVASEEADRL